MTRVSNSRHAAPRAINLSGNVINDDVAKYCAAIGIDPNAPIKACRSPPKATKGPSPVESPEDEHRGSCLAYENRNLFTGAPF
jgi:hypothetical protein